MADSFFGFDNSVSNLNDEDGPCLEGSEDEYDALNDETFGQADEYDWEVQHEQLSEQIESGRKNKSQSQFDESHSQLEASLSQLVLDETDAPHSSTLNSSSVWQADPSTFLAPKPIQQQLKNVCTVEELERQLRQNQQQQNNQPMQQYFQPRFPVILQRPPNIQGPNQMQYPPQMMTQTQHNQNIINHNHQSNPINHQSNPINQMMNVNPINHFQNNMNQYKSTTQMIQNMTQMAMQNMRPNLGPNMGQNMGPNQYPQTQMAPNAMGPNQMGQNHLGPNSVAPNHMTQNSMGQNNMGQNPMMQNGQFGMNQFQNMMNQQRMMGPPPGMNVNRSNMTQPNMNQANMNQPNMTQTNMNQSMNQQFNSMQQYNSNYRQQQKMQENQDIMQNVRDTMSQPNFRQMFGSMFQYGNSVNNASHHPLLNKSMQNGGFNNNNSMSNGDVLDSKVTDEYAGLMSQREKQWLINIQMLQLNTGTPYIDDFYYTVFLDRKSKKEKEGVKEAHKANQQNHPLYSGGERQQQRERHNSNRHNSQNEDVTPRTYVPTQFENSLGRLQCGSVTAPRKIIDVDLVQNDSTNHSGSRAPSVASTNMTEMPREMKRTKQVLLDIESLYLILLRLEELNEPLAISNALILKEREEKQKLLDASAQDELDEESNVFLRNIESVHKKNKDGLKPDVIDKRQVVNLTLNPNPTLTVKNLLDENREELVNRLFNGLLFEDRLQQFLLVRKGKSLICRVMSRVCGDCRCRVLWSRVMRTLTNACRRDPDALTPLAKPYREYINSCSGWSAVLESISFLSEAFDPARTPYALTSSFTLSCVCALIEKTTQLVNTPEATRNERQWTKFLKTFARATKNTTLNVARPIRPLQESKLLYHIKQLESRNVIEILQRGKIAEFADLSTAQFHELLVRHLC